MDGFIFEQGLLFFGLMNVTEDSDMQLVKHQGLENLFL